MALIKGAVIKLTGTVVDELIRVGYQNDEIMTPPNVKVPEFVVLYVNPDNDHFGIAINRYIFKPEMLELPAREIWVMDYAFSFEGDCKMIFFPTESLILIAGFFAAACLYGYYNFMEIGSEQMDLLRRDFWFKKANICRRWSIIFIILAVTFGISASIIPAIV